jgi:hypothetical protein
VTVGRLPRKPAVTSSFDLLKRRWENKALGKLLFREIWFGDSIRLETDFRKATSQSIVTEVGDLARHGNLLSCGTERLRLAPSQGQPGPFFVAVSG